MNTNSDSNLEELAKVIEQFKDKPAQLPPFQAKGSDGQVMTLNPDPEKIQKR